MVTSGLLMAHLYTDMRPSGRLDPEEIKKAKVDRAALRRAWGFARAYRGHRIAYLATRTSFTHDSMPPPARTCAAL